MLIVYEGYEEQAIHPLDDNCFQPDDFNLVENMHHTSNCCYDADASNDSSEMNLSSSHEDSDHHHRSHKHHHHHHSMAATGSPSSTAILGVVGGGKLSGSVDESADYHQRGYGEAAARGAKVAAPFVPLYEETVFLDSAGGPSMMPSISASSPMSGDSWMNYSSNSSDDYSCLSDKLHKTLGKTGSVEGISGIGTIVHDSTDDSNSDLDHSGTETSSMTATLSTTATNKRNFEHLLMERRDSKTSRAVATALAMADKEAVIASVSTVAGTQNSGQTKRHRGKESKGGPSASSTSAAMSVSQSSNSGSNKRRLNNANSSRRNSSVSSTTSVDIRMIDFAHTAFMRKNGSATGSLSLPSTVVQHQGPDNGFLRGLDSLKRLLTEICTEDH